MVRQLMGAYAVDAGMSLKGGLHMLLLKHRIHDGPQPGPKLLIMRVHVDVFFGEEVLGVYAEVVELSTAQKRCRVSPTYTLLTVGMTKEQGGKVCHALSRSYCLYRPYPVAPRRQVVARLVKRHKVTHQ
jgi:hypothetical protein